MQRILQNCIFAMKKYFLFLAVLAITLVGCEEKNNIPNPSDNSHNLPNRDVDAFEVDDATEIDSLLAAKGIKPLTVAEALEKGAALETGKYTSQWFYIKGIVQSVSDWGSRESSGVTKTHVTFNLVDDPLSLDRFYCYQVYGDGGQSWPVKGFGIERGNVVVLYCQIKKFGTTIENHYDAYVWANSFHVRTVGDGTMEKPYLPSDVRVLRGTKSGSAYVRGFILGAAADETKDFSTSNIGVNPETGNYRASNIVIADTKNADDVEKMVPVQLLSTGSYKPTRDALKLNEHPDNIGREVLLYGSLKAIDSFLKGAPCVTEVTEATLK